MQTFKYFYNNTLHYFQGIVVGAYTKNENCVELLADGACINEETNGSLMKQLTM